METISHLIERLEKIRAKYGDKPVLVWTPNSDDLEKSEDCLFVVPEEYQDEAENDSRRIDWKVTENREQEKLC